MPSSDTKQALVAAFAFGIIVHAAIASLFLFTKDHGWQSLRDGPRLVLIVFLVGAALWAQIDFIAMTISGNAMPGCQVAISFTTVFDQIARVSFIQFLIWVIQNGSKTTAQTFIFQGLVLVRFVLGAVIVGMTRPQISSMYCIATTLIKPLNLSGVVFDCVIAFSLLVQVFIQGSLHATTEGTKSAVRRKVLVMGIVAFAIWSALSAPMLLGYESLSLVTRTLLPAIGLGFVIAAVALNRSNWFLASQPSSEGHEGPSARGPHHNRDPVSQDSGYSTDSYSPPNRYEEIKGETVVSINAFAQAPRSNRGYGHSKAPSVGQIGRPHLQQGPAGVGFDAQAAYSPRRRAPALPQVSRAKALPKKSGKVQISAPVLVAHAESSQNPLQRIATIDLATAARHEKERREMPLQPLASNLLVAHLGTRGPLSPNSMRRNNNGSVKRKQVAGSTTDESVTTEPLLNPDEMVTTTSSQLSPGVEELRRRSPRHPPQGPLSSNEVSAPRIPAKSARRSQHALSALTVSDAKTRPSSLLPITPPPKSPKHVQPPLSPFGRFAAHKKQSPPVPDRHGSVKVVIKPAGVMESPESPLIPKQFVGANARSINGLPRNPRMTAMKTMTPQEKMPKEQTVMLLKNIEYDDPSAVHDIMNSTAQAPTKRVVSVVNRPRPIPRQSVVDRQIFPAEGSPSPRSRSDHKRSLSGGSGISRKSILQSVPTSPSQLPPLPPVPMTAGQPGRPLPNNTRSMTFDEKMDIFYPNGTGGEKPVKAMRRRSSSVPELPELPAAYKERSRSRSRSRDPLRDSAHQTDKSSRSSIRTASLLDFPEVPVQRTKAPVSKFSVDTTVGEGLVWAAATKAKFEGAKRQSSPVLPVEPIRSPSYASELKSHDDDTTTLWGSIHSPVKCTIMQKASAIEVPPVPAIGKIPALEAKKAEEARKKEEEATTSRESHVMMTVVLDTSDHGSSAVKRAAAAELERVMEADTRPASWHRRIGDQCPMFSGRQDSVKRRKNPPPAPLPLNRTFDRRPRLMPPAEPSPLEAPEQALLAIQEQLRKFEDPNRESTGSQQLQRMTLLASLEAEMGAHESQWQKMHSRLDRDSFSTTAGSPRKRESRPDSLAVSIVAQADDHSQKPERSTSRPSTSLSKNKRAASIATSLSTNSVENEHEWDEDLAEAQAEYLKNRHQLVSHLSTRTTSVLIASPTKITHTERPPARHLQEREPEEIKLASVVSHATPRLWQPAHAPSPAPIESPPSLWTGSAFSLESSGFVAMQPEAIRRPSGRVLAPLTVQSSRLWEKKQKRGSFGPQKGLWVSKLLTRPVSVTSVSDVQSQSTAGPSRPLARKPSRRSKRVTLLPDILENPEPMPDKRGTLAIYQFPWGEKSDTASIRPRPQMFMAMPGTMTSGRSMQSSQQPQQVPMLTNPFAFDADNYSASYFDDEDDGDNFPEAQALSDEEDGFGEEDDSDDFDETTLWEIASLLKSNLVPSRESLLPEDWRVTTEPDEMDYSEHINVAWDDSESSSHTLVEKPEPQAEAPALLAKTFNPKSTQSALRTDEPTWGSANEAVSLPQPESETWQEHESPMPSPVRAPTRNVEPAAVTSESFRAANAVTVETPGQTSMWQPKPLLPVVNGLWIQQPKVSKQTAGLTDPSVELWAFYQIGSDDVIRATVRRVSQPCLLESTSLWQPQNSVSTTIGLWTQQDQVHTKSKGISHPSRESWAVYQARMADVIRAPTRPSQASTIESTSLWELTSAVKEKPEAGLWTASAPEASTQLWSVPSPKERQTHAGLAQPSTPTWTTYTATDISPVRSKPRPENLAVPTSELGSSALWGAAHASPVREDWISLSTIRARSPSTSSVESNASDASSIKSTMTKASTVGSIFSAFWRRKRGVSDAKTEESMPEVPEVPAVPAQPALPVVAPKAKPVPIQTKPVDEQTAIKAASTTLPLRRQHRPTIAYRADWDAALEEALLASYPSLPKRHRPTATAADWAAALSAALPESITTSTAFSGTTQLWSSAPLKSPVPTTSSLWSSNLSRAPRTAFPAGCSVLPNPARRARSGSLLLQQDGNDVGSAAELAAPEGLTKQSLWRRSIAIQEAESRTRNWLAAGLN